MQTMARIISAPWRWGAGIALLLAGQAIAAPGAAPVPGAEWERIASPEAVGWSTPKLALAREHSKGLDTAAVMLVVNGKVLDEWGRTQDRYNIHSIRKSILSGLIGIAVLQQLDHDIVELDEAHVEALRTTAEIRHTQRARVDLARAGFDFLVGQQRVVDPLTLEVAIAEHFGAAEDLGIELIGAVHVLNRDAEMLHTLQPRAQGRIVCRDHLLVSVCVVVGMAGAIFGHRLGDTQAAYCRRAHGNRTSGAQHLTAAGFGK